MVDPAKKSQARRSASKQIPLAEAKVAVLDAIARGLTRAEAMATVGRKLETYRSWCAQDAAFKAEINSLRTVRAESGDERTQVPDFPEFCAELGMPMYAHQRRIWDVINSRPVDDLHPLMRLDHGVPWDSGKGDIPGGRMIVNGPPGFAKSTTFTVLWVLWLIHRDPNVRVILVSKTQGSAKLQLGRIRWYLTSSVNRNLINKYGPAGGWKDPDQSWTSSEIFVQGKGDGERDPTVQALGIGGQIYGARADVIILDDVVTLSNVNEYEKQIIWLDQEVESRLDGKGMMLLLNTRVAPVDLFSELRSVTDADDNLVYTYFSQPALLDEGDGTPETWVSLWPEGFPPSRLRKMRRNEARWALVYQQQDVADDATFNSFAVEASINTQRFPGPMTEVGMGHRPGGMNGLWKIGSVDPAAAGCTAMIVGGIDRETSKRWVMDGFNHRNTSAQLLKDTMKRLTVLYKLDEWIVEANAFQRFLTQDTELVNWLRAHNCKLTPHYTNGNKTDPDFGVMAMAQLFMSCGDPPSNNGGGAWRKTPEKALIELPSGRQNAWVSELKNQLVTWQPSGMGQLQKTDLVMALWFFDLAARKILDRGARGRHHQNNPYASRGRLRERTVIDLRAYREALLESGEAVG